MYNFIAQEEARAGKADVAEVQVPRMRESHLTRRKEPERALSVVPQNDPGLVHEPTCCRDR